MAKHRKRVLASNDVLVAACLTGLALGLFTPAPDFLVLALVLAPAFEVFYRFFDPISFYSATHRREPAGSPKALEAI